MLFDTSCLLYIYIFTDNALRTRDNNCPLCMKTQLQNKGFVYKLNIDTLFS